MDGRAKIEKDQIVIRLDIKSLPVIVEAGPNGNFMKVTNKNKFAKELVKALNDEEEDGTTLIHKAIDEACSNAFENGAEGCTEVNER